MNLHEDLSRHEEVKGSSDRSFGLVFAAVFLFLALRPLVDGAPVLLWWLIPAAAFALAALVRPGVLHPLNRLWIQLGLLLGRVVSPIVMGLLYYVVITPIGMLARRSRSTSLRLRYDPAAKSYWVGRDPPGPSSESMSTQF